MSDLGLLIDFGSTFTKLTAIDLGSGSILARTQSPTTVGTNISDGYLNALSLLQINGRKPSNATLQAAHKRASSSAAGGLGIVAVGLVPELTLEAARKAALGAGGKVIGSFAFELDAQAVMEIESLGCDMILLAGGVDGGNKAGILHNARMLAASDVNVPIVLAGNRYAAAEAQSILEDGGKIVSPCANVLPALDRLSVEAARERIREVFISRIVEAKGFGDAQDLIGSNFVPTPRATLQAASLLAEGTHEHAGLGPLLVVEVGGATINVHSVGEAPDPDLNAVTRGVPEPYEKRTVEGDLGIRINAATILGTLGSARIRDHVTEPMSDNDIQRRIAAYADDHATVPRNSTDFDFDIALASAAVDVAMERHAGRLSQVWAGGVQPVNVREGKDLSLVRTVIGTGGIFAHNPDASRILESAVANTRSFDTLRPRAPKRIIDTEYCMYAIGLLADESPDLAFKLARNSIPAISQ